MLTSIICLGLFTSARVCEQVRAIVPLLLTQAIILFQDTSLVYVIGLGDFFTIASNVGARDGTTVELVLFAGACYFCVCTAMSAVVRRLPVRRGGAQRARRPFRRYVFARGGGLRLIIESNADSHRHCQVVERHANEHGAHRIRVRQRLRRAPWQRGPCR